MTSNVAAMRRPRAAAGRYGSRAGSTQPGGGLARPLPSLNVRTAVGVVPNPLSRDGAPIQVRINRRVDLLEQERSHRRISESAYQVGRELQTHYEREAAGLGELNLERSGSARANTDMQAVYGLESAQDRVHLAARIEKVIGTAGGDFLRASLSGNLSFPQLAASYGQHGERGVAVISGQWRWLLEQLATRWAARGVRPTGEVVYALRPEASADR